MPATFVPLANWSRAGEARIYYLIDWHITTAAKKHYLIIIIYNLRKYYRGSGRTLVQSTCSRPVDDGVHCPAGRSQTERKERMQCTRGAHYVLTETSKLWPTWQPRTAAPWLAFWFEFRRVRASTRPASAHWSEIHSKKRSFFFQTCMVPLILLWISSQVI